MSSSTAGIETAPSQGLPKRRLGRTDMQITRVGFGAWAIGGGDWIAGWGSQDDRESIAAIQRAVDLGVNWIDTAAIYGLGHSEDVVRRALKTMPLASRPLVFTKCGLVWNEADRREAPMRVGTPESVRRELEASLKRLDLERIDLYQMHWPPTDGSQLEDYWSTLLELKREGKVRAVGLSNHDVDELEAAERLGHVDTLQPPFSAIRRESAESLLPWCAGHETGVIVYSPMQSGLLTGRFSKQRVATLPSDDWRSRSEEFSGEKLERNLELAEALGTVAARHETTTPAVSIAWTLAWPGVTGAIVGARTPSQVEDWIAAASLELNDDDMLEIAAAIDRTGAGAGPSRPSAAGI